MINIASSKEFKLIEKNISNTQVLFCFNALECPFVILDYTNIQDIKVFIRGDFQNKYQINSLNIKGIVRNNNFNLIGLTNNKYIDKQEFNGGVSNFKGLIGRAMFWIEKNDFLQFGNRTRRFHPDQPFIFCGKDLHKERLNQWNQSHVEISRDHNCTHQFWSQP